jgi:hypothetical protein
VHKSRVSEFESGKSLPTLSQACALAAIYGKPVEVLFPNLMRAVHRNLDGRLPTLPSCSGRWLGRFNRQNTLNELAVRVDQDNQHHV